MTISTSPAAAGRARPGDGTSATEPYKKGLVVLTLAGSDRGFAWCLVDALQLLVPRNMPFGVTGPSPVVSASKPRSTSTSSSTPTKTT